jgi:hypothetical protein
MKFIRKRNYWAFLPLFVLLRVAIPVDANATTDWLTPWEEDEPTEEVIEAPQGEADPTWATELAKTACYAMKEGKSFTASIIFATASHATDYNDQAIRDDADMEILSLEIGNAIVSECRTTAVNAFDAESIPVSEQVYFKQ